MPQRGKQYWQRLEPGLFRAESPDGRSWYLEWHATRTPDQDPFWTLSGPAGRVLLATPHRDKAIQLALRRLGALRVVYDPAD